ncbi:hypothetical protein [Mesorhizobium sp.]|uniref:hypothetical protein n=1 Tax=Mesorhizobium sp. TaxID=1871066 RepID=UPI0025884BBD|nr:hypothetical protein [Mesorhizobium sp.]
MFDEYVRTKSLIACQALDKIGAIFAVEREINGRSAAVRGRRSTIAPTAGSAGSSGAASWIPSLPRTVQA